MTEIHVPDEGGDVITMVDFGDFRSSLFGKTVDYVREVNANLPHFEFRDDDILVLSYPKSGCTWMFEILSMLVRGVAEKPEDSKMDVMLEARAAQHMEHLPSPRILNSHLPYNRLPHSLQEKKVKIVFVIRNPKDAAVSLYHMMTGMTHYHYEGKFHNWLPLYMRGDIPWDPYFKYLRDYEKAFQSDGHNILIVYYEHLKKDIVKEIGRLLEFLGINAGPELVKEVAMKCQFREMKSRYSTDVMAGCHYKESHNYGFMRKGEVGDWKNWFTVAESEKMDACAQEQMKNSDFKFIYEL